MVAFLFTFAVIILSIAGLAAGVLAGRSPIKGSCGGVSCLKGMKCSACPTRQMMEANDE